MKFKKTIITALLIIPTIFLHAQNIKIGGRIADTSSNPVEGATVHLLNTNHWAVSGKNGDFSFDQLDKGIYIISISAIGFASMDAQIEIPKQTDFNFRLTGKNNQLDAVIVTAEKSEQQIQRIPSSVTALNARKVEEYRLWNSKDLTAIVPNLYAADPGDGRNVISVRGITSTSYDPAVTTYIDGVNQFTLDTYMPQLVDIERIEVLRGPQGTLYGRNAMGGVINIVTKQPRTSEMFFEASLGNYGLQRYVAGVRAPFAHGKFSLGINLIYEERKGYYHNNFTNTDFDRQNTHGGNLVINYYPSSTWEIVGNLKYFQNRNMGAFPLVFGVEPAFNDPFKLDQNAIGKLRDNVTNGSITLNHYAKSFRFSSQTAYEENYRFYETPIDGDFSPIDGITIVNNYGYPWNSVKAITEELKFSSAASSTSRWNWTAGSYLFYHTAPNKQATHFGKDAPLVGSQSTDYSVINTTKAKNLGVAFFGQIDYLFSEKLRFILGARYDYQHSKQQVLGEYQPDGAPDPIFETRPDTSAAISFNAFSPKLSVLYHVAKNSQLYASYNRGFRTGGLTQLALDPSQPPLYPYKPEYSNSFEAGMKNTLFENKLQANIALFYTIVSDAQVPTLVLPDAITITRNAGKLKSKGVELETSAIPLRGLELTYNFGYTDATYTTLKLSQNGTAVDASGNRQVFTPDITSLLAAQYSILLKKSSLLSLVLRGEWKYLGQEYFDLANSIRQAPHNLLNARVGVSTKYLGLFVWVRNISDSKYISYAYDFGAVHLGAPRTYGLTLSGKLMGRRAR